MPVRASAATPATIQPHLSAGRVYDPQEGFSIIPPEGYHATESPYHFMSFLGPGEDGFTANFNVTAQKDDGTPIEQAAPKVKHVLPMLLRKYAIVEEGFTTLAGRKVYFASGRFTWQGVGVQNLQYFIKGGNGRVYILTFASRQETFPRYRTQFEQSASTVLIQ